jgi:hypothetical protein
MYPSGWQTQRYVYFTVAISSLLTFTQIWRMWAKIAIIIHFSKCWAIGHLETTSRSDPRNSTLRQTYPNPRKKLSTTLGVFLPKSTTLIQVVYMSHILRVIQKPILNQIWRRSSFGWMQASPKITFFLAMRRTTSGVNIFLSRNLYNCTQPWLGRNGRYWPMWAV